MRDSGGAHLCEELLKGGHQVTGIDAFIPYYPVASKERNLAGPKAQSNFHFHKLDLRTDAPDAALADAERPCPGDERKLAGDDVSGRVFHQRGGAEEPAERGREIRFAS